MVVVLVIISARSMSALKDERVPIAWTEKKGNLSADRGLGCPKTFDTKFQIHELSVLEYFEECSIRFCNDSTSGFVIRVLGFISFTGV